MLKVQSRPIRGLPDREAGYVELDELSAQFGWQGDAALLVRTGASHFNVSGQVQGRSPDRPAILTPLAAKQLAEYLLAFAHANGIEG